MTNGHSCVLGVFSDFLSGVNFWGKNHVPSWKECLGAQVSGSLPVKQEAESFPWFYTKQRKQT